MTQSPFQPSLPNERTRATRQEELRKKQQDVQYDFDLIPSLPMFGNFKGFPKFKWLLGVAKIALELQQNTAQFKRNNNPNVQGLFNSFAKNQQIIQDNDNDRDNTDVVNPILPDMFTMLDRERIDNSPGNSLEDYEEIFATIDPHLVTNFLDVNVDPPKVTQNFLDNFLDKDEEFAWMRVAGSNPLVIEKLTDDIKLKFPVTDDHYKSVIPGDSLDKAFSEGRLFVTDYAVLADVQAGITDGKQKYIYAPLALFALPPKSRNLKPIAIQCGQDPVKNPIVTPNSGEWAWKIAKTIVQIADANHHELISHLGLTHLLIEPFAIATERQLAQNHPLGILLRAHFEGTFFINDRAGKNLIGQEKQPVDEILAGTLADSRKLSAKAIQDLFFDQNLLPDTFKTRGVDSDSKLLDYPYRDDALEIWNAIHQWVLDYLKIYYINPIDDVTNDNELQKWVGELTSFPAGGLQGLKGIGQGRTIRNLSYLVDITTQIIFTASAQHAAVNFSQPTLMSYTPAMPMAGYAPIPTDFNNVNQQDFLNLLPPIKQAQGQLDLTYLLGSVYYTKLGEYPTQNEQLVLGTDNPNVSNSLQTFKNKLKEIETKILEKNKKPEIRRKPYEFLIPSKIPQSINI